MNLTDVRTTVIVAVVVDGLSSENFSFSPPPPYAVMAGIGPACMLQNNAIELCREIETYHFCLIFEADLADRSTQK